MATQYKPIIFSTEMVQAILEGRKKLTRRTQGLEIINKNPNDWFSDGFIILGRFIFHNLNSKEEIKIKPKFEIGDILWVRETFQKFNNKEGFAYYASENSATQNLVSWKPSIHMPKEAARIFLEVTNVRVERLQDITEEDVIAEGVKMIKKGEKYEDLENGELISKKHEENYYYFYPGHDDFRDDSYMPRSVFPNAHISSFFSLWCLIHNEKSWKSNPWVWVYEFKVVEKPKDFTNEH